MWPTALWFVSGATTVHVADRLERLLEREQPARLDAVVVGDEDARPARSTRRAGRAWPAGPGRRPRSRRRPAARRVPCRRRVARIAPARASCRSGPPGARPGRRWSRRVGLRIRWRRRRRRRSLGRSAARLDVDRRCRARARAACGPAGPRARSPASSPGRPRTGRPRPARGAGRRRPTGRPRSGSRRSRPGCRRSRRPMSTDPRTTIGWIPTAPCMSRGWRTFMTTNQPTPMSMIGREQGVRARRTGPRRPAAPRTRTARRTGSP